MERAKLKQNNNNKEMLGLCYHYLGCWEKAEGKKDGCLEKVFLIYKWPGGRALCLRRTGSNPWG